ncbi:nuclear transport factor 2 family protein [Saccharopolyspora sp. 5N708]|uniref:nuclear transport factor 2 family protein n=1 Tax=Saccharopolyspora sp. 5N708 TaxID=3457424 RepID=UPI003FD6624B
MWNEPDPGRRRSAIAALWAEDGVKFTDSVECRGHRALQARITQAHEQLVEKGGFVFRAGDAAGNHDAIGFKTYLVPAAGDEIAWTGFVFVRLGEDGRILQDYQFGTSSQLVKPTDKRFVMTFAPHLTIDNGLITRHHMYEDSLAVAEAFNRS